MNARQTKEDRFAALDNLVKQCAEATRLDGWNGLARAIRVPVDMMPAIMSGRTELLTLVRPRAMDEEEVGLLLEALASLIETNTLLKQHAEQVSTMVSQWGNSFKALHSIGNRIEAFAAFKSIAEDEED